ncbi:MAG: glycoside hydrolase family 9 protein, partial [Mameliella sp.]|nr:glycoside hydrolase family 9 protein [Phaeodactylibacter sp.]
MRHSILLFFLAGFSPLVSASNIISVSPLTDRVLLIHFDDGEVHYPNDLIVDRLDVAAAQVPSNYILNGSADLNYANGVSPVNVYRKTKGTEFVKDVPWNNAKGAFDPTGKPWAAEHWIYLILGHALQPEASYTLETGDLAGNGATWTFTFDVKALRSEAVHTNTIGYLPDAPKYGYIYQWMGDGGGLDLSPYQDNSFFVYHTNDLEEPVLTGTVQPRKLATNAETGRTGDTPFRNFLGAEVYDCDFSELTAPGEYILAVEGIGSSFPFSIGPDALKDVATTFGRALYYQRSGIRLAPPFTDGDYIRPVNNNPMVTSDDGTDFSDLLLYSDFPFTSWAAESGGDTQDAIKAASVGNTLQVAGWYHDAGDWDSYSTHHKIPAQLLLTYEYAPERFADDELNLPESGNGIPDIVDEASWLIKFNYRLRKELMENGYSDGGVGGARICPDVYSSEDGNAQENKPSWQDHRRYVVTQADAFMTYYYAGQAAHFAHVLKSLGKDPTAFPVELLDAVAFEDMSYDEVNWIEEAEAAYTWASHPDHQPESDNNYRDSLAAYQLYAAVNLFRLTGNPAYQEDARPVLENLVNSFNVSEVAKLGLYSFMAIDHMATDVLLQRNLENTVTNLANLTAMNAADRRALRWGGLWDMPMLVGQGTTPWVLELIMAYELTKEQAYLEVIHQTIDYFLGGNPMHTTWSSGVGPRPVESGFHLDSRYNNNWVVYPGHMPYGPWSLAFGYNPVSYTIDGVEMEGGRGPWNKDWHNFSMYPMVEEWPGHSRYCYNIHAPTSSENTIHQNTVFAHLGYGYASRQHYKNAESVNPIGEITLSKATITLDTIDDLDTLIATLDIPNAGFGQLKWSSSEPRIAHVDKAGYITGITAGEAVITCSTLDGSVQAQCIVYCDWMETPVEGINIELDTLKMIEGQERGLNIEFTPIDAPNQFLDWETDNSEIANLDPETQVCSALAPGNTYAIATSMNGGQTDTLIIEVSEATDYVIVDFDAVIPVTDGLSPESPQVYAPQGLVEIDAANPLPGLSNPSEKVVAYHRPAGNWRLIGFALPTDSLQDLSRYSELQFQYFGKLINDFMIQINTTSGNTIEVNAPVSGEDCWQLFTAPLNSTDTVETVNVFVNPQEGAPFTSYFDEVKLAGQPATFRTDLSLSSSYVEIEAGDTVALSAFSNGGPFTFISENPAIVSVDQEGQLIGFAEGETLVKAVPLYGEPALCQVKVE